MGRVPDRAFVVLAAVGALWAGDADAQVPALSSRSFSDQLLRDAAFDRGGGAATPVDAASYAPGLGLARWSSHGLALGGDQRVSLSFGGGTERTPAGQPLGRPEPRDAGDVQHFGLNYRRDWPGAVRGRAGGLAFDVTPRAGLGVSDAGNSAGAGATVRFGQDAEDEVARALTDALGLNTVDASSFGGRGRWYLFAAADGRAVGMNVLRDRDGDWSRGGWSSDAASSLVSEAQVGVGWRRGAVQASFGYMHREIKVSGVHHAETTKMDDGAVAFSLSIKPEG